MFFRRSGGQHNFPNKVKLKKRKSSAVILFKYFKSWFNSAKNFVEFVAKSMSATARFDAASDVTKRSPHGFEKINTGQASVRGRDR